MCFCDRVTIATDSFLGLLGDGFAIVGDFCLSSLMISYQETVLTIRIVNKAKTRSCICIVIFSVFSCSWDRTAPIPVLEAAVSSHWDRKA